MPRTKKTASVPISHEAGLMSQTDPSDYLNHECKSGEFGPPEPFDVIRAVAAMRHGGAAPSFEALTTLAEVFGRSIDAGVRGERTDAIYDALLTDLGFKGSHRSGKSLFQQEIDRCILMARQGAVFAIMRRDGTGQEKAIVKVADEYPELGGESAIRRAVEAMRPIHPIDSYKIEKLVAAHWKRFPPP